MTEIKVVTFNTLARKLCTPDSFKSPHYNPKDLEFTERYRRLWTHLQEYIKQGYIICLQEIDATTSGIFQLEFEKNHYKFFYHSYGNWYNDYMGIAIAVPAEMNITCVNKQRIADLKNWPTIKSAKNHWIAECLKDVTFGYLDFTTTIPKYYAWNNAKHRRNFLLTVTIKTPQQTNIHISTVHMPCAFRNPSIMITYTALVMKYLQTYTNGEPFVLAGDFNFTPDTEMYKLVTTGECDFRALDAEYPAEDHWRPTNLVSLSSAVKRKWGKESDWTTHSFIQFLGSNDVPFKGTIDYIFISNDFDVKDAFRESSITSLCPNEIIPSDHLPVWAVLKCKAE